MKKKDRHLSIFVANRTVVAIVLYLMGMKIVLLMILFVTFQQKMLRESYLSLDDHQLKYKFLL